MNWPTATFLMVAALSIALVIVSLIWAPIAKRGIEKWDGKASAPDKKEGS